MNIIDLMIWKKRRGGGAHTVSGVPPLTYKAIEGTLKNYRIYGNTGGVGDKTANQWGNGLIGDTHVSSTTGLPEFYGGRCGIVTPISITGESSLFITFASEKTGIKCMYSVLSEGVLVRRQTAISSGDTINVSDGEELYVAFYRSANDLEPDDITNIMLNTGSTPLPYEPYGYKVPVTVTNGTDMQTTNLYLPEPIKMVGDEAEYIDYAEQKQHVDADEEIEKQAATYMVSITPKTDVSKIVFVTMSSVPDDCTILTSGLIFTLDEADANTLNSTNYADGVRGKASTAHNYEYTWTKKYTEGETYYIRSYVKYQTADNEIKEVYGDVYKADINGFERVRKNQLDVTLPALPTLPGTNVLSVGTAVQPSQVMVKGKIQEVGA